MLLNYGVGEDSRESFGLQGDPTSPSWRKSVLNIHWKDWCWSWSSNTSATWCEKLTHWKRLWCWEWWRREQQRMRQLDCIINLMDMSLSKLWELGMDREAWYAGSSMRSQTVGHNWHNWIDRGSGSLQRPKLCCQKHFSCNLGNALKQCGYRWDFIEEPSAEGWQQVSWAQGQTDGA